MSYQQFPPIDSVRSRVDAYWINRPHAAGAFDRVLPDGCIDLIFHGGAGAGRLFSSALIERPLVLEGAVQGWFVGVRFRPAMARAVLDIDPLDCRDRDIPAGIIDLRFAALEDELRGCASADQALDRLKRGVDARLAPSERHAPPLRVQEAILLLGRGGDAAQVSRVARTLGTSARSLHRDIVRWSGLAPKPLARILRMQRALAAIRAGSAPLANIALHLGYADQAHMTRELKALTGFTPAEIARQARTRDPVRNLQDAA